MYIYDCIYFRVIQHTGTLTKNQKKKLAKKQSKARKELLLTTNGVPLVCSTPTPNSFVTSEIERRNSICGIPTGKRKGALTPPELKDPKSCKITESPQEIV